MQIVSLIMFAKSEIIIDTRRELLNSVYPIKLRITFMRKQKYYPTVYKLTQEEFLKAKLGKDKKTYLAFNKIEQRAISIIETLGNGFSFLQFESKFVENNVIGLDLLSVFESYISKMSEDRIRTIQSYRESLNSFLKFNPKSNISIIDVNYLNNYEKWMRDQGRSPTTIGIYMRNLRSIFNQLISTNKIDKELYPFGSKHGMYDIPKSKNIKKALTLEQVSRIYNYDCKQSETLKKYKDIWMFLYLANGINIIDFCLLKWEDIKGDFIYFVREKSKRTKRESQEIKIFISPDLLSIIDKWKSNKRGKKDYVFPYIDKTMTDLEVINKVKSVTKYTNQYMKKISIDLGFEFVVTSYYARHSFATILRNSGAPVALISQALGHSSLNTTQSYLASFEDDQLKNAVGALTNFKK